MLMDRYEIATEFLTAADKRKQITILAELNTCKEDEIVEILEQDSRVRPKMLSAWKIAKGQREAHKRKREEKAAMKAAMKADAEAQTTEATTEPDQTEQQARVRTPIMTGGGGAQARW